MTAVYLSVIIILVIAALVVRDQTEFKLTRLRADLLALRSEEQRLSEERTDLERMIAQASEALMRADNRQRAAEKTHNEVVELLRGLDLEVEESEPDDAEARTRST